MRSCNKKLTPFGKYVAKSLTDRDMTRAQLAAAIGTSPQYLSYILNGTKSGNKYIEKIIAVLELDPNKAGRLTAA
jgi:transcriptional regulator with XRE-family HTH domain